jgi:ABC-type Fe3+ transport system permease subunit
MMRTLLFFLAALLVGYVLYTAWLWSARRRARASAGTPEMPQSRRRQALWTWVALAGLVLVGAALFAVALTGGSPPGGVYEPAHVEDGRVVPGHIVD